MNFHEWTDNNGEVLILRRIPKSRITNGDGKGKDFVCPTGIGSVVERPDWNPEPKCGGGLHGWPLGFGLGDGCDYDILEDIWLVVGCKPGDVVGELDGGAKCKFRLGTIRLEGSFGDAMRKVQSGFDACVVAISKETQSNNSTAASSGDYSTAASSGNNSKAASSGDYSKAASSGDYSKAEAIGENTAATISGDGGRIRVGGRGAFALAYWSNTDGWRFLCGKVGDEGIKANVWYEIREAKIVECKNQ